VGGFAQYVYLPWNAVVHRVPKGVTPELADWSPPWRTASNGRSSTAASLTTPPCLSQGARPTRTLQTVVCKQAGASLIIVTGTSKDVARMKVAKELGADHVIDVQKEDPLARIKEITSGRGVDVALDCTAGAGTLPTCSASKP